MRILRLLSCLLLLTIATVMHGQATSDTTVIANQENNSSTTALPGTETSEPTILRRDAKNEKLKREDPHGFGISLLAMGIVFFCLAVLFVFFWLFGVIMRHMETAKKVANQQPIKPITLTVEKTIEVGHKTNVILQNGLKTKGIDKEIYMAVIGMALKQYEDDVHDVESGIITIKQKTSSWNEEFLQMTQFH